MFHTKLRRPLKILSDDEILGMVSRAMSAMRVDEETLAVDVIARVGPGHHFLAQKPTNDSSQGTLPPQTSG